MIKRTYSDQSGSILVMVLIVTLAFSVVGIALSTYVISQQRLTYDDVYRANAILVAEAGIERSVRALNTSDSFAGYAVTDPEATLFDNNQQGRGVFETTVENAPSGNSKTITSTGKVYRQNDLSDPVGTSIVKVTVVGTQSSGYAVGVGPGGLKMSGSATVTNSTVYVEGKITFTNSGAHIGSDTNPATVYVANKACPSGSNPGSTYPARCSDPSVIIPDWSSAGIIGTTCANDQTQTKFPINNSKAQIRGPNSGGGGLNISSCSVPDISPLPPYNRSAVISAVTTTVSDTGAYACNGNNTVTYPANTKIADATVKWSSGCTFVISGNLYIPGDLTLNGGEKIKVADSVGTTRPLVVVDGKITASSGSFITNSSGTGVDFVSFKNSTGDPAATPTGTDLYSSTQTLAVDIGGGITLPGISFDAYWGKARLGAGGNVGAIGGQAVEMSGGGSIIFGTILGSGTKTWSITSYQRLFPQ